MSSEGSTRAVNGDEPSRAEPSSATTEILIFEIAASRYGVPAAKVRELLRAVSVTPLPNAPRFVEGIINVRGELIPVVDLAARFGLPNRPISHTDHLIVVWTGEHTVAIRAERASHLVRVEARQIEPVDRHVPGMRSREGVAMLSEGLVLLIEPEKLFADAELDVFGGALAPSVGSEVAR